MNRDDVRIGRLSSDEESLHDGDAREATIGAGKAVAESIRTTLGPRGMDKMLVVDGRVIVTNDGVSILDRLEIDDPAARVFVETARSQDRQVGDGTTTAVTVAAALLREAEALLEAGVHPTIVTNGYQLAMQHAGTKLAEIAIDMERDRMELLHSIARTSVTGKWSGTDAERFADLAVRAVRSIETEDGRVDRDRLTLKAFPGGSLTDSELIEGVAIDLESSSTSLVSTDVDLPTRFEDPTVALIDTELTVDTPTGISHLSIETPEQREQLYEYEERISTEYVTALADAGVDVVFCQKSIDDSVRYLLAKEGIVPVERTRQDELHTLARATGATLVRSIDEIGTDVTGTATAMDRHTFGTTGLLVVSTAEMDQYSLLLRGGTQHVAEETKRIIKTCLRNLATVVADPRLVAGGGAPEAELARAVRSHAVSVGGREQLAIEAFADALESVPRTLATSAGLEPTDVLIELRNAHHNGDVHAGIDVSTREIADTVDRGIVEPLAVRKRALEGATEAANALLRVDDIVTAKRNDADDHDHNHDHGRAPALESDDGGYPWAIGH